MTGRHTLAVLVENKPGALMRVAGLFARRGYNIESLAVGTTERPHVSRITLRVECDDRFLEQIETQIHKLENVLRVQEHDPEHAVERELALIKVAVSPDRRGELVGLADVFRARVVALGPEALVFEVAGTPRRSKRSRSSSARMASSSWYAPAGSGSPAPPSRSGRDHAFPRRKDFHGHDLP